MMFEAELLDCEGNWAKYGFNEKEFIFERNYTQDYDKIQIWKGVNNELFLFRNVGLAK